MRTLRATAGLRHPDLPMFLLAAACLAAPAPAAATMLYELDSASSYQEGCFDPCDCPVMMNDTLRGTFVLSPAGGEGETEVFAVTEVAWVYLRGESSVPVTGSGTYTRAPGAHRLELDLLAGDGPWRHFDSGLVAAPGNFPRIVIAAAVNGFFCYDYVFAVSASAAAVAPRSTTWGACKATYR